MTRSEQPMQNPTRPQPTATGARRHATRGH